ncbi:MAG: hypothetical protein F9B45_33410 [Phycisphaera sp. RhM]|nr:hypothetical protein [Phycisphaera sp. RhM]
MTNVTKIRSLVAPKTPLGDFDPGAYLSSLEFYETDVPLNDMDRDGLAQFIHYLAFIALSAKSTKWKQSTIAKGTAAYHAVSSHFSLLEDWDELNAASHGIEYSRLARFLMGHFPPQRRT